MNDLYDNRGKGNNFQELQVATASVMIMAAATLNAACVTKAQRKRRSEWVKEQTS